MKAEWRNDGEPVDGMYEAIVDLEDGSTLQVFRGASYKAVADALLKAQGHGTRRLAELRAEQRPAPKATTQSAGRPLSADERMQLAHDIQNPAKTDEAIVRVLESKGINLAEVSTLMARERNRQEQELAVAETQKFALSVPDWNPTAHNMLTLVNYMQSQGMKPELANFTAAFETLTAAGLLQPANEEAPPQTSEPAQVPERISPATTRPRTTLSTGVRSSTSSAPQTQARPPKYTRRDIDKMEPEDFERRLNSEPGFSAAVAAAR